MIVRIRKVLPGDALDRIEGLIGAVEWIDGRETALGSATSIKYNRQARLDDEALKGIRLIVMENLMRNEAFTGAAFPMRVTPPLLSCYDEGMYYGDHVDLPIMQGRPPVRTDLAATLFLSESENYDGGELIIGSDLLSHKIKLDKGDVVLYPAETTHRVETVRSGRRLALIFWVQSFVRHADRRALLSELAYLESQWASVAPKASPDMRLRRIRATLMRMWADT